MPGSPIARQPTVWLLLDDRPGHRTQVIGLARSLGWPAEEKPLRFNRYEALPQPVLGSSPLSLDLESRARLAPPYPDLVIGMGRRIVPAARWIRRRSGGRTRIVLIGRKVPNDPSIADLTVACAHFGQIAHPGLFEIAVPPTQVNAESLAAARTGRPDPMAGLASPRVLLLVGGPTAQHFFAADFAGRMAGEIAAATAAIGGSLAIVTSRRTPEAALAAMRASAPQAHVHQWQAGRPDNPYMSYLAHADCIVATGESESMIAEAVATGLPLTIYPLPPRPPSRKRRLHGRLAAAARGNGRLAGFWRWLFARNWITPPRDLAIMHDRLVELRLARMFDGAIGRQKPPPHEETALLARRIEAMLRT